MVERVFHEVSEGHVPAATGTQSIDRAAQLLVHVLETREPPTVGALSERSGLPKSTTSRLVGALERQGSDPARRRERPASTRLRARALRAP